MKLKRIIKGFNFFVSYVKNYLAIEKGIGTAKPIQVHWNITNQCNFKCVMCPRWKYPVNKENELSVEVMKKLIDDCADWKIYKFGITGGEPFLRKEKLFDVINYAASKGIWVHVGTNASLINDGDLEKVEQSGIRHLSVSIDGIGKNHDDIRVYTGSYNKIVAFLKKVKNCSFDVKVNIVLTSKNVHEIPCLGMMNRLVI